MKKLIVSILSLLLLSFAVHAQNPPTFTSPAETAATQDAVYTYNITTEDIDGEDIDVTAPTTPDWLDFTPGAAGSGTGVLTGTPGNDDVTGDNSVLLTVSDGGESTDQSFTIIVANVNDAPTFTSPAETAATQDAVYTYNISTEDIDGDDIDVTAPTTPDWLDFTPGAAGSGTGVLTGTPDNDDVTGDNSVLLTVSDGPASTNQSFTIIVANVNDAPTFTSVPITSATQDVPYTYTAVAEDIDEDDVLTYSAFVLPGWLDFDEGTQVLSGTPADANVGDHNVTLRVNDGTVNVDQIFTIVVANVNDAPTFTSVPVTSATQDVPYTYTAVAEDIDEDALEYTAPVLPTWLAFDKDKVYPKNPHKKGSHLQHPRTNNQTKYDH
jgi:putative Ig domain-containing protein